MATKQRSRKAPEAKHTPGPWYGPKIYHDKEGKPERIAVDALIPSGITHEIVVVHEVRPPGRYRMMQHVANARLISVAPELLTELRILRDYLACTRELKALTGPTVDARIAHATELIKRAEGKE